MAEKPKNDIGDVGSKAKTSTKGKILPKSSSETNVPEQNRLKADAVRPQKLSKDNENGQDLNNNLLLECLKSIQQWQVALVQRMDTFENSYSYCKDYEVYEYNKDQQGPSSPI